MPRFLLTVAIFLCYAIQAYSLDTSYYAANSRLSSGKWVKISTAAEGIYQLSYSRLRELGFENPEAVQVYGYGALALPATNHSFSTEFPDDLQPVATLHEGQRILFFGQGDNYISSNKSADRIESLNVVRNYYDTSSTYFLSDAAGTQPIPVRDKVKAGTSTPSYSHIHIDWIEEDLQNPTNGGCGFHGQKYSPGASVPYEFRIKNYSPSKYASSASFAYCFGISTPSSAVLSVTYSDNLKPGTNSSSIRNTSVINTVLDNRAYGNATGHIFFSPATENALQDDTVRFSVNIPSQADISYAAADRVVLRYPRANRLDEEDAFLVLNLHNFENRAGQSIVFTNTSDKDVEFWNIDDATHISSYPSEYNQVNGETTFVLDATTTRVIAFKKSSEYPSPLVIGDVPPQNLHGMEVPEMLIITIPELIPQAERIASLHRQYQGMDVAVVDHNLIFNEFSSGTRDAMAYRRLVKMLYDRNPAKLKYLFFFGPSFFDNRSSAGNSDHDRLLCYEQDDSELVNSIVLNYAADSYFGMLDDSYVHSDIHMAYNQVAVGRIPAFNASDARIYADKVEQRFTDPPTPDFYNNILLIADAGDKATHAAHQQQVDSLMHAEYPMFTYTHAYKQLYPNASDADDIIYRLISSGLKKGTGYMSYSGHGSPTSIAGWSNSRVSGTDYEHPTFVMFSSCDQFDFDHMNKGLVETMLFKENGGAIAGVAAVRSVYISANQIACLPTAKAYATATADETYGSLFKRARDYALDGYKASPETYSSPKRLFRNLLCYNLAGDPALPVAAPRQGVVISTIDGKSVASNVHVNPLTPIKIEGYITTEDGNVDKSFNGQATINIFDGAYTRPLVNTLKEKPFPDYEISFDSDLLTSQSTEVVNGRFAATVSIAVPSHPSEHNRMTVTALSSERIGASGYCANLQVNDYTPEDTTSTPSGKPYILDLHTGRPTFPSGSLSRANVMVYATIDPSESGLSFGESSLSSSTRLTVDGYVPEGLRIESHLRRDVEGKLLLEILLTDLAEGIHTIELTALNNAGLSDHASCTVNVSPGQLAPTLEVEESPARTEATFNIDGSYEVTRMLIADYSGHTVFTVASPSFPFKWNLCDTEGKPVANGRYTATVLVKSGADYGHATTEVIVLK